MEINEQTHIPYSPNTEASLLGALMSDNNAIQRLPITTEDFYLISNQYIYAAMQELSQAKQAIDLVTVCSTLDKRGHLAEVGGPAAVMKIGAGDYHFHSIDSYVTILKEKTKRRKIIEVAQRLVQASYDSESNLPDTIAHAMDVLSKSSMSVRGAAPIRDLVSSIYDEVEKASVHPQEVFGISTGLAGWDKIDHGLQKGTVVKLSGEPGVGKSLLACQILAYAASKGHPGALYEFEMGGAQVVRRLLSAESRVTTYKMRGGMMTDKDWPLFIQAVENLCAYPIYMCADAMDTAELRADLYRLKDQFGVEVVVVDYEALLEDNCGKDEVERSMIVSSRVHKIAKDLNLAMIVVDDMNKVGITGTVKGKAGLSGSARKLHDADEIVILRQSEDRPNVVLATWDKNREGEGGAGKCAPLVKLPELPAFADYIENRIK